MPLSLNINGSARQLDAPAQKPLLWVLREDLGLTGTKFGCGLGLCGACTVQVDGVATRSCVTPAGTLKGRAITTVEGFSSDRSHPLQRAWLEHQVPQCGYCQSGMLMSAAALLKEHPKPSDAQIDAAMTNLCRCGTYPRVRAAIHRAAALMAQAVA